MQGLRKQEDAEFEAFMEIVQRTAKEKGCVFFVDSGEGNDVSLSGIEGEDLSGWLIPFSVVDEFEPLFKASKRFKDIPQKYGDYFRFAKWSLKSGKISIHFSDS